MTLVFIQNNRPVTDSLTVAETFGKRHDNVLRDIKELECSDNFSLLNFEETTYSASNGQRYPKYLITQDGFSFLVMGYTGKEAARFKEMYIGEFNRMRDDLNKSQFALPQNFVEALKALVATEEEKALLLAEKATLQSRIESDRPLVVFAESLQVSEDCILIGQLAKLLKQNGIDIGQNRLFQVLRDEGYLMRRGERYNMPTQRSMEMKLMEIKVGSRFSATDGSKVTQTTKVTGKGVMYFINKFKEASQSA